MVRVRVTAPFRDKYDYSIKYNVGEEHVFEESRALLIVKMGLGEIIKDGTRVEVEQPKQEQPIKEEPAVQVVSEEVKPKRKARRNN